MTAVRPQGARPLPTPPSAAGYYYQQQPAVEAAWYEHEERMRPSYIQPPHFHSPPPLSPSARWNSPPQQHAPAPAALPFPSSNYAPQQPRSPPASGPSSSSPYSAQKRSITMPGNSPLPDAHQQYQQGARPRQTSLLPPADSRYAPGQYDPRNLYGYGAGADEGMGSRMNKGSAFMHKGFFDILSLVNDRSAAPSRFGQQQQGSAPPSPSRLKATLSRATGGLKKMASNVSGNGGATTPTNEDPFLIPAASIAPQRSRDSMQTILPGARAASPATFSHASGMQQTSMAGSVNPPSSLGPASMGPRAQKKRISIDMVGAPQLGTFVHAAHASDADQAEEILRRWSRDGVGKIADPAWVAPIKQAMRVQQARNQAEAIAQVQAALHQDSLIRDTPRQFHIVNGNASNLTTSTMTATTITAGTAGHGSTSTYHPAQSPARPIADPFQGIAEEVRGSDGEARDAPSLPPSVDAPASPFRAPASPSTPRRSPRPQAPGLPRTNTAGTMVIASTPDLATLAAQDVPDYLQFRPAEAATGAAAERPLSKAIDGLPSAAAGGINALFDAPPRPASVVVRDSALETNASLVTPLSDHMALAAGAAIRPSLTTVEKSVAAKIFFENLYYGILKKPRARDTRRAGLEAELAQLRIPESSKAAIRAAWAANETEYLRDLRARVNVNSFAKLKTIGHGAFGVVALCKERGTGELFAMKQLRKADMLRKGQEGHVRAERDLMTSASASASAKWIVKLVYSFQDVDHLYLIMEFMGGGDLLNLLIEKDIFAEDFARFYVAEMVLAIHEAHRLGYIHRDIKPDNFLFTSEGHIKLADFGLCQSFHWAHDGAYYDQQRKNLLRKHGIDLEDSGRNIRAPGARRAGGAGDVSSKGRKAGAALNDRELGEVMADRNEDGTPLTHVLTWRDKNKKKIAYSVVGTNNYMAPEVLRGMGYDQSCDWWSLGVIVFEMLYGYPPFVSKSRHLTRQKILNWRQTLRFPPKPKVSRDAQDFISRLICEKDDRLGSTANASVSRPNSLLQGSRQRSGFMAPGSAATGGAGGLVDGVEELMSHPWFRGVDWDRIHTQKAPFRPNLSHPADTKHFEDDIEDEPLPAPGAAEAAKNGQPPPVDTPRDPMLRDKDHGQHLLEMRKQLAFVGYTFKSPKQFDPKTQLSESKIVAAERAAGMTKEKMEQRGMLLREPTDAGSRLRSMSM